MSTYRGHKIPYQKVRFAGKLTETKPNPHNPPKIKFVKKADRYVLSYFETDERNGYTFKQKWAVTREELENSQAQTWRAS